MQEKPEERASQSHADLSVFADSESYWELMETMKAIATKHGKSSSVGGTSLHFIVGDYNT